MADLTGKTIAELQHATSISDTDLLPVMSGGVSKYIQMSEIRDQFYRVDQGRSANNTNIDELLTEGTYYVSDTSTVTGTQPTTAYRYKLLVQKVRYSSDSPILMQTAFVVGSNCTELRRFYNGTTWGDWVKTTNANDLASVAAQAAKIANVIMSQISVSAGNQRDIELENNTHGVLLVSGYTANLKGMYIVYCSNVGDVSFKAISEASTITLTAATNALTVANSSSAYGAYCLFMSF